MNLLTHKMCFSEGCFLNADINGNCLLHNNVLIVSCVKRDT